MVEHHALAQEFGKGLVEFDQTQVTHHAGPEARIQQVHDCMFDPADVLIHRHPVVVARVNHGLIIARRGVTHEIPRRIHKRIHGVGFASRILTATRTYAL